MSGLVGNPEDRFSSVAAQFHFLHRMSKILKQVGVSDPGDSLPEGMSIRQVTLEDRDAVIQVHDNVKYGTDRLPAYYNYWLSLPEVYAVGLYDGEKMVGPVL